MATINANAAMEQIRREREEKAMHEVAQQESNETTTKHYIEESVSVYLKLNDTHDAWVLDQGAYTELASNYYDGAVNVNCECGEPDECYELRENADSKVDLPGSFELLKMLAEEHGYELVEKK